MAKYESTIRAITEYEKNNYERITLKVQTGGKDAIKAAAEAAGVSVNRYILEAVEARSGLKLTLDNALPWMKK